MKPIIGIVPLVDQEKESLWMLPGYVEGIMEAGGIPVILPLTSDEGVITQLLDTVQGILLTGGQDVDPRLYGEEKMPECGETCKERDEMERELLTQALEKNMPILGICRGIQFLNAYLGGTLYQDLVKQRPSNVEHHQNPPYDVPIHDVDILEDGILSGCTLFGGDKNKETPSSVALESPEPTKEPEQSTVVQETFSFRRSLKRRIKLTSVFEDRSYLNEI